MIRTTPIPKKKKANAKETKKAKAKGKGTGKRGRPSKLDEELKRQFLLLTQEGIIHENIAKILGVAPETLKNWKKNNADLLVAIKEAEEENIQMVEASLFHRALGYSHSEEKIFCNQFGDVTRVITKKHFAPDMTAIIFYLCNKASDRYKRNADPGTVTEPITINENFKRKDGN